MKILLREPTDSGIIVDHVVDQDSLSIGRGTDCDIYLPDPLVGLHHATVFAEGRQIIVEAATEAGFLVDGQFHQRIALKPGMVLGLGVGRVQVGRADQASLSLTVVDRGDGKPSRAVRRGKYRLALAESGARPRRWAAAAALLVLAVAVIWPLAGHFAPSLARAGAAVGANPLGAWESGGASRAHRHFMDDCQACHVNPFQRAADEGCLGCHEDIGHHAEATEFLAHPGFADAQCHDCHREHNGPTGLIVDDPRDCTTCHAAPHDDFPDAGLQHVADFGDAHPGFAPTLPTRDTNAPATREPTWTRQPLASAVDDSGLYFNHARHTDPAGVRGDDAGDQPVEVLACNDCHRPHDTADGGRGFAPVDFERDCQRCHALTFDPDEPEAQLPHGESGLVIKSIREHFVRRAMHRATDSQRAQPAAPRWRRPGASEMPEPARQAALAWAETEAGRAIDEAFSRRVCGVCHVTVEGESGWQIAPVALADVFLPRSRFSHAAHRSQTCTDCHATDTSTDARDVLLPTIADCRTCHTGHDRADAAPSACVDCHGFHTAAAPWTTTWDAAQHASHDATPEPRQSSP